MNLVFLFPDQLGAERLGCYGVQAVHTPCIDELAREGVMYERAYTASPICTPFRGVLFSGLYPYETGVRENGCALPNRGFISLAEHLNQQDYITSYVGKWHLSGNPQENRWVPPDQRGGFSDFVGWESHHVDHWNGLIFDGAPTPIRMEGHETDALTQVAIDRLERLKNAGKPFCLFVAYQAPHPPCTPPTEYAALYEDYSSMPRGNVPDDIEDYHRPGWNAQYSHNEFVKRYFGEISHLDAAVGRVLHALDELNLSNETAVVFTSDHGEMAGSHGLYGKGIMKEESVHVPLIVRIPGRDPETTSRLFSTVDFYPTILSLLGGEAGGTCRGIDQSPFWLHGTGAGRYAVFSEYHTRAAIDERYKVITDMRVSQVLEVYDLVDDPLELHNRAHDTALTSVVRRLTGQMKVEFGP